MTSNNVDLDTRSLCYDFAEKQKAERYAFYSSLQDKTIPHDGRYQAYDLWLVYGGLYMVSSLVHYKDSLEDDDLTLTEVCTSKIDSIMGKDLLQVGVLVSRRSENSK